METVTPRSAIHDRMLSIFRGEQPDRLPFIGRLEIWHRGHLRTGTLPPEFRGLSLNQIHRAVGMGQQLFFPCYHVKLHGVEVVARFEGEEIFHETDPVVSGFPRPAFSPPEERPGMLSIEFITPVGTITTRHTSIEEELNWGISGYMIKHPFDGEADYRTAEYVLERAEFILRDEELRAAQIELGDNAYVVPHLGRIPFQQVLIDYFHTTDMFYALHDEPKPVQRLLTLLDERVSDNLRRLASLDVPYVEFGDNLDGTMTNPRLFTEYCQPVYDRYLDILHGQGKRVGTHADGELKPLLGLMAASGLDVCESFSPYPLTSCSFEEAWDAWQNGPIIWGGIPSPLLEERTSEEEFRKAIAHLLQTVGSRPIILCVTDMVLTINSIDRIRTIAEMVESHALH